MDATSLAIQTPAQPKKLFYRIKDVARITGVQPYVLRYWEGEFPELAPEKDTSDQRRYRPRDIQTILAIRKLLYEDRFTIKGARKQLKQEMRGGGHEIPAAPIAEPPPVRVERPTEAKPATVSAPPAQSGVSQAIDSRSRAFGENLSQLRKEVNELLALFELEER